MSAHGIRVRPSWSVVVPVLALLVLVVAWFRHDNGLVLLLSVQP